MDHDGKAIDIIADVVSIGCGIYNLAQNIKAGNSKAAWGDVAGIGLDLVCAVIPGATINAGTAKTLAKSSLETADKVVDAKGAWSLNPFDRGKSLEATLKGWGTNFPVIDMYDDATKTITSMKSLDLNAKVINLEMLSIIELRVILMICRILRDEDMVNVAFLKMG